MTLRSKLYFHALAALLALTGCAGYGSRLDAYRAAAPPPFDTQTMSWLAQAEAGTSSTLGVPSNASLNRSSQFNANSQPLAAIAATTSTASVFAEIVSDVTGLAASEAQARLAALDDPARRDAMLGGRPSWRDVALAVAAASPEVRAARQKWQATLEQFSQADHLEALLAQYRTFTRALDVGAGEPVNKGMLKDTLPFPGTVALKAELVRREAQVARLEWEKALREALLAAGKSYFENQYIGRAAAATRDNVDLVQGMLGVVQQQYRAGIASQADLLKVQNELERQRNMLGDLGARRRSATAELNAMMDRAPDAMLGLPLDDDLAVTTPTLSSLEPRALAGRQEMRIQAAMVERMDADIRMGEVMNRPPASQGYSAFDRGMGPISSTGGATGESPMMPYGQMNKMQTDSFPDYARGESFLVEMRRRREAEASMLAQARAETRSMTRSWVEDLDIARRAVALVRNVIYPQNRSAYEALLSGYSSGGSNFLDLLDTERALIDARLELEGARRDLNETLLREAEITGQLPGFAGAE